MVTLENNILTVIQNIKNAKNQSLKAVRDFGLNVMDSNVAVRTGKLKSGNKATIHGDSVIFQNDIIYAPYVEFGTYKMTARPFIGLISDQYSGQLKSIIMNKFSRVGDV
jgi:HK97 gp10 family phage protein